jgi:hypothetical protein
MLLCTHAYTRVVGVGKSSKQPQAKAGSGWGFNLIKYILPKKKNEAHLPDDKKPTVSCHLVYMGTYMYNYYVVFCGPMYIVHVRCIYLSQCACTGIYLEGGICHPWS